MKNNSTAVYVLSVLALLGCKFKRGQENQVKSGAELKTKEGYLVIWAEPKVIAKSQIFQCLYSFVYQPPEKSKFELKAEQKRLQELEKFNDSRRALNMPVTTLARYTDEQSAVEIGDNIAVGG